MKSDESCRKSFACKELARHTSAGTGFPKITERQAKACRHRPTPLLTRGRTGCFDPQGHPILCRPTKLCQESIPAHCQPEPLTLGQDSQDTNLSEGLQWAVTPKLTMIAGQQLSIGALPVRSSLLDINSSTGKSASRRRVAVYGCK